MLRLLIAKMFDEMLLNFDELHINKLPLFRVASGDQYLFACKIGTMQPRTSPPRCGSPSKTITPYLYAKVDRSAPAKLSAKQVKAAPMTSLLGLPLAFALALALPNSIGRGGAWALEA